MISVRSNNLSFKYQKFTPSGCKDIGIRIVRGIFFFSVIGMFSTLMMATAIRNVSAMCNGQCAMCNVQWAMCNVQCAMCNVQCAMCNGQWAMCLLLCKNRSGLCQLLFLSVARNKHVIILRCTCLGLRESICQFIGWNQRLLFSFFFLNSFNFKEILPRQKKTNLNTLKIFISLIGV